MNTHNISLTTAYGEVVACEQFTDDEFARALRRFYNTAMQRMSAIVVLDGVAHTRNSFIDFVREFDESSARAAQLAPVRAPC